jgi:hypothetical protein
MANHVDYDTDKRIIYVTTAPTLIDGDWVVNLDVKVDLYSDSKEDWLANDTLNKFHFPIRSVGGDDLPGEKSLGATFFLDSDWKVKPYEASHVFKINGNFYSEDGTSPFVSTSGVYNIMVINTVSSLVDSIVQQQAEIEYASFGGGVTLDMVNGGAGTDYPLGTLQEPVNNLTDAMTIATERGFGTIYVIGNATIDAGSDYSGMIFIGESQSKSLLTISTSANVSNCEFHEAHVEGILDGNAKLKNCVVENLDYVSGYIELCVLAPKNITLSGLETAHFLNCWSGVPGSETPTIDMGGSGQALSLRNYNGGIKLINKTGNDKVSIDMNSGHIILDSTVTNGDIVCRGIGKLTDNSTGTTNVLSDDLINKGQIADAVLTAKPGDYADQCNVAATIVHTVYDGQVYIDSINGSTGTDFPTGTIEHPVNNLADAKIIATGHGMRIFNLLNTFVIGATDNINDYIIRAPLNIDAVLVLTPGCTTKNTRFDHLIIMGTFNGKSYIDHSTTLEIHNFSGFVIDSILMDNIEIVDPTVPSLFNLCGGGKVSPPVEIDLNNSSLNIGGWKGEMKIVNKDGSSTNIIELVTGQVTIDATCIAGTIILKGVGRLIQDDSGPGCTVITTDLLNENRITNAVWADPDAVSLVSGMFFMENIEGGRWKIENNQMIFYEEDNTTEIMRFNLFDEAGDPANTDIFDRQRV